MKIIRNKELATLTFIPMDVDEQEIIASIAAILKPGDKLSYGGKNRDGDDDKFCAIDLYAGAREEMETKIEGNITVVQNVHVGGVKLVLRGSTEDDKREVGSIRDTCYFGSDGLIFIGETEADSKKCIITTGKLCKYCNARMISCSDCESGICAACAVRCPHNYVRGAIHGGSANIAVGEFCAHCNRVRPKSESKREKSLIEHHLAVEKELGIKIFYKGGFPNTPRQALEFEHLTSG